MADNEMKRFIIMLIGDKFEGERSLRERIGVSDPLDQIMCVGGFSTAINIFEINNEKIKFEIRTVNSSKSFETMRKTYYPGATGAILVFDNTNQNYTSSILEMWLKELRAVNRKMAVVLVNNLIEREGKESIVDVEEIVERLSMKYKLEITTSEIKAFTTEFFEKILLTLGEKIIQRQEKTN
ncbi:MAG: hypothetical protein ACTSPM_08045 [Candidatus Heimdallarchaeota archaeon]